MYSRKNIIYVALKFLSSYSFSLGEVKAKKRGSVVVLMAAVLKGG